MNMHRDLLSMLSDPELLEKIDKLRDLNIGQHAPLPQLVAVGDQSSGKSALLESLTGIPFLKGQGLCTRHITQITCRRAKVASVSVRIIAGPHATEEHKKYLDSFQMTVPSVQGFRKDFVNIFKKVNEKMGLRTDLKTDYGAVFSEDVLKIEVYGPDEEHLTIIDVPGIFRTNVEGTTKDDMVMVRDLVKQYIRDDWTIILAVLPSNVDVATQEILELAEEFDKNGERTLGVLTKPDLVTESDAQAAVCDLIQGKKRPLTLGYYLIRNLWVHSDSLEQPDTDRTLEHKPWSDLPPEQVGVSALKAQLRTLLAEITRRGFPKLCQNVRNKLQERKKELNDLGPSRQGEREQRSFLSQVATAFQDRARAALAADYITNPIFGRYELRLITQVVNITEAFYLDFQSGGHSRRFENLVAVEESLSDDTPDDPDREEMLESTRTIDTLRKLMEDSKVDKIAEEEYSELGNLIVPPSSTTGPQEDVPSWINDFYFQLRGMDLGTFNANLVAAAFAEQSRKWEHMTKLYMSRVIITLHRFIAAALRSTCRDDQARRQLWDTILDSLKDCYKKAMAHAELLVEVEKRKPPYTLNSQFSQTLSKARGHRITETLRPKARKDTKQFGELQYMVNLDDIVKAVECKGNTEQLKDEIHDILYAYYGLARDRFIDNVFQLSVDYHLLHGPSSPLKVFNQEWVINLEPEQLERIAGESKHAKILRSRLSKQIDDLSKALKILKT